MTFRQTFPIQTEFERISLYFDGLRPDGKETLCLCNCLNLDNFRIGHMKVQSGMATVWQNQAA